jgi:hypothetical protein
MFDSIFFIRGSGCEGREYRAIFASPKLGDFEGRETKI